MTCAQGSWHVSPWARLNGSHRNDGVRRGGEMQRHRALMDQLDVALMDKNRLLSVRARKRGEDELPFMRLVRPSGCFERQQTGDSGSA